LPLAIGAVVEGLSIDSHTPLSGQISPVLAVVPNGVFDIAYALSVASNVDKTSCSQLSESVCCKADRETDGWSRLR